MQRITLVLVLSSVLLLSACGTKTLTISSFDGSKTVNVRVEVADSPKEREQGLMNRTNLPVDAGMLFVFEKPSMLEFWMKNTLIPLDIMFFDADGGFVSGLTMEPCTEEPCPTYKAAALAVYALEVNKDFRTLSGIGVSWKIDPKEVEKISNPS